MTSRYGGVNTVFVATDSPTLVGSLRELDTSVTWLHLDHSPHARELLGERAGERAGGRAGGREEGRTGGRSATHKRPVAVSRCNIYRLHSTLNPQPSTLNPQPSTLNPQPPSTLNPQPSTLNPHGP